MVNGRILIGWSRTDITPSRKTLVQGQFHTRISKEIVSPLTATVLALEVSGAGGVEQAVFVSCDLVGGCCKDEIVQQLKGRCEDFDRNKLTINGTHTHTGPCTYSGFYDEPKDDPEFMKPEEYRRLLVKRLADAIEKAWTTRQPGSLARGFGYAVVARCRRATYANGTALMYGSTDRADFRGFESCDDHAVNMLFTHDAAGKLTGMVVNLACPSQCQEGLSAFGADFWHPVREGLAARYGAGVHLLPQCAPAGDMSPHLLSDQKEEADLRHRLGVDDVGIVSRRILAAVEEALATASPPRETLEFVHLVKTLRLPRMMVTKEQYELEKRIPSMSEAERKKQDYAFQRIWPFGPVCDLVKRYEQQEKNREHEVESHFIRLGDVAFATNPFELFVDYGMQIRCRSKALQTFLVQLADGADNGFYLPTQRALDGGHYSALVKSNWVAPAGGQKLVEETVSAINALFAGQEYPKTR